jgi:DNA-binding SARP family transcriptional activator
MSQHDPRDADSLADELRRLDAAGLEAWARAIAALAAVRAGDLDAREAAVAAESSARRTGANAARLLAHIALAEAEADPDAADEYGVLSASIARETGLYVPMAPRRETPAMDHGARDGDAAPPPVEVRVLGGFELRLNGRDVDVSAIRPRARALLRLLAMNARARVHHEAIENALWPDADADASARNLHVAVAAVRRALEPAAARGSFQLIRRDGDAYVFDAPPGSEIDIACFDHALAAGRIARDRGDTNAAATAFHAALDSYRGELLPEDGPAEWVAGRREACRLGAVEATQAVAEILLSRGEAAEAARTATIGLAIERYHDPLWRLLIEARDRAGDQGAANRARVGYGKMLSELGVAPLPTGSAP